mmetsp:Transcript_74912/g.216588  ORF Transcript_74912/g.216588 Transcript_74912/m.216588 type:complete len:271 (+) Transcript_74912:749-1561(+)
MPSHSRSSAAWRSSWMALVVRASSPRGSPKPSVVGGSSFRGAHEELQSPDFAPSSVGNCRGLLPSRDNVLLLAVRGGGSRLAEGGGLKLSGLPAPSCRAEKTPEPGAALFSAPSKNLSIMFGVRVSQAARNFPALASAASATARASRRAGKSAAGPPAVSIAFTASRSWCARLELNASCPRARAARREAATFVASSHPAPSRTSTEIAMVLSKTSASAPLRKSWLRFSRAVRRSTATALQACVAERRSMPRDLLNQNFRALRFAFAALTV